MVKRNYVRVILVRNANLGKTTILSTYFTAKRNTMSNSSRLLSLDVFRGLTIALMILVNCPGSWNTTYAPLLHADWHGNTPTDQVFPFFLFIVGIAITFSMTKRKEAGENMTRKILSRTAWIVGLGLLLSGFPKFDFATWRIPGVLTRIGVVYGICAFIFLKTNFRQQFWIAVGCLFGYWALMTLVPVPGQGYASLEAGKDLGAWLDRTIFGNHLWSQSKTWDPEGLLGTIPSVATCLAGMLAGNWLRRKVDVGTKWATLLAVGFILYLLGNFWGYFFPINKKLWTSSYVLFHSGLAMLTLGAIWWLVDEKKIKWWTSPFVWFGMNPLFIYIMHGLIVKLLFLFKVDGQSTYSWIYENVFNSWLDPYVASLAFAMTHVLVNLLIAFVLWKRKIFIKV